MSLGSSASSFRAAVLPNTPPAQKIATTIQAGDLPGATEGLPNRSARLLTRWDILGMLAGVALTLTITAVLSRGRIFWEDEMLAWLLLHDPSWHHMLQAWNAGADGGGFTFYLLGRAWFRLFGPSELAFRLYSSTCFALAFVVTWIAARRYYATEIVAFALFNTWFFCTPFELHIREGRFYGQLILSVALAIWLVLLLAELPRKVPSRYYALVFAVHAFLTMTHLLGILFSAFFLGSTLWLDLIQRKWRPLLYLSGAASWLLLLLEKKNIVASARVGKPYFWVGAPNTHAFLQVYSGWSVEIGTVLIVLLVMAIVTLSLDRAGFLNALRSCVRQRRPVYIVVATMFLIPVAFVVEGHIGTWLFAERYLLPFNISLAYLTAELCRIVLSSRFLIRAKEHRTAWKGVSAFAALLFIACLVFWDFHHVREFTNEAVDYTDALTAKMPRDIPVVCEDAFTFTELIGHQHSSGVHYVFLLDWPQSISPFAPRVEVTQYHLMENWRNVGYFSGSIQPAQDFLAHNPRFVVIHAGPVHPTFPPEIGNPLAERFRHTPGYEVRPYAFLDRKVTADTAWLVCKGTCSL